MAITWRSPSTTPALNSSLWKTRSIYFEDISTRSIHLLHYHPSQNHGSEIFSGLKGFSIASTCPGKTEKVAFKPVINTDVTLVIESNRLMISICYFWLEQMKTQLPLHLVHPVEQNIYIIQFVVGASIYFFENQISCLSHLSFQWSLWKVKIIHLYIQ